MVKFDPSEALWSLIDLLVRKNEAYGDSALNPLRIFSSAEPEEGIRVRIDDKLSRIRRGAAAGEDPYLDLAGYLLLLRVARRGSERASFQGSLLDEADAMLRDHLAISVTEDPTENPSKLVLRLARLCDGAPSNEPLLFWAALRAANRTISRKDFDRDVVVTDSFYDRAGLRFWAAEIVLGRERYIVVDDDKERATEKLWIDVKGRPC